MVAKPKTVPSAFSQREHLGGYNVERSRKR
jgi:hypothetical protein